MDLDELNRTKNTEESILLFFEREKGLDALEELQKNPNNNIYLRTIDILTKYFEEETPMELGRGNGGGMNNINGDVQFNI